jgi:hypothetical protein
VLDVRVAGTSNDDLNRQKAFASLLGTWERLADDEQRLFVDFCSTSFEVTRGCQNEHQYARGAAFIDLAPLSDLRLVPQAVGLGVGVRAEGPPAAAGAAG